MKKFVYFVFFRDGVSGCGVMLALIDIIFTMKQYQKVNVYRTCLKLKRQRPEFITSMVCIILIYLFANVQAILFLSHCKIFLK